MDETLETIMENAQEDDYPCDLDEEGIDLSLLRLDSFGSSSDCRALSSSPPKFPSFGCVSAAADNCSPLKRPSPESEVAADEPKRKKLFLRGEEDPNSSLSDYSKISLPFDPNSIRPGSSPVFRRSLSDTFASPLESSFGVGNIRPVSQETSPFATSAVTGNPSSSLPPRPRVFRRSVSDLTSSPAKTHLSRTSAELVKARNPEADKMLLVIKDGVQELDRWCDKLLQYGQAVSTEKQIDDDPQVEKEADEPKQESHEGVTVKRVGDGFYVQLKCPCEKSYRILFSGRDCYYQIL